LLDHAYGTGADVEDSVIEVYISRLRRRLRPYGISIKSQRGLGYQLIVEPEE
jgi:DNA-binding response OmpR family regulator